jgi:hypothetical protein
MTTGVIVAIAVWNGLLLLGLLAAIRWRKQLPTWVTSLDRRNPPDYDASADSDAEWAAFLADHPELLPSAEASGARRRRG